MTSNGALPACVASTWNCVGTLCRTPFLVSKPGPVAITLLGSTLSDMTGLKGLPIKARKWLKRYSVILTTSFYGMDQKIINKKAYLKMSVDSNFTFSSYA